MIARARLPPPPVLLAVVSERDSYIRCHRHLLAPFSYTIRRYATVILCYTWLYDAAICERHIHMLLIFADALLQSRASVERQRAMPIYACYAAIRHAAYSICYSCYNIQWPVAMLS